MTEETPGCVFVVFTACLNDDTAFEEAQPYCLLPSRTDSALAVEGRTARADAARHDGMLLRFAGRQRTDGPRRRNERVVQRTDATGCHREQRFDEPRLCEPRFAFDLREV
jgi:hypothetical protein